MPKNKRDWEDRRKVERREPKRGVNIRHDDENYIPKRARAKQIINTVGKDLIKDEAALPNIVQERKQEN